MVIKRYKTIVRSVRSYVFGIFWIYSPIGWFPLGKIPYKYIFFLVKCHYEWEICQPRWISGGQGYVADGLMTYCSLKHIEASFEWMMYVLMDSLETSGNPVYNWKKQDCLQRFLQANPVLGDQSWPTSRRKIVQRICFILFPNWDCDC